MKKILLFLAAASLVGMAACNKSDAPAESVFPVDQAEGLISFSLTPEGTDEPVTKAVTAYTTAQTYESKVNSVQLFVFHADGKLAAYKNNGTAMSGSISTTAGAKTVWAVVNGPTLSSIATLDALKATAVDLAANSVAETSGFLMVGSGSCTVSGTSTASCSFNVSRLVSRVALSSIKNALPASYGTLKVERVFLSNVVGNQNLAGNASASTWYNKDGRADESTRNTAHIIDGSTYHASCEALTFKSVGQNVANAASYTPAVPLLFYTYPNSATAAPAGFSATFSAKRSVLTVVATVDNKLQYYPVVLDNASLERNMSYTVALTITGPGSDDPDKPVEKGSLSVSFNVLGWAAGSTYDETI